MGPGVVGLQRDGLAVAVYALVHVPIVDQHEAQVGVRAVVGRIEANGLPAEAIGLPVVGGRLVQPALSVEDRAAVKVSPNPVRINRDGIAVTGDGLVHLPTGRESTAETGVGPVEFGIQLDGLAENRGGFVISA